MKVKPDTLSLIVGAWTLLSLVGFLFLLVGAGSAIATAIGGAVTLWSGGMLLWNLVGAILDWMSTT